MQLVEVVAPGDDTDGRRIVVQEPPAWTAVTCACGASRLPNPTVMVQLIQPVFPCGDVDRPNVVVEPRPSGAGIA